MKYGELLAYKVYQCKLCPETREDSTAMWRHLQEKHGVGSIVSFDKAIYRSEPEAKK